MDKNNKNTTRYFGELVKMPNGKFKAKKIQQLVNINQYKRAWLKTDAREFARDVSRSGLVIK